MKLECTIKREGGTKVLIGDTQYHFEPASKEANAPHVCEVTDAEAVRSFLAVPEAYRSLGGAAAKSAPAEAKAPTKTETPETGGQGEGEGEGEAEDIGMVLKSGRKSIDLAAMNKRELMGFAKEAGFKVTVTGSAQKIREEIFAAAKAGA